jgi:mRNA interferase MazF
VGGVGAGVVVLVRFPFSDLSSSKLRPALVVASAGGTDWILCQITSNPYSDPAVVALTTGSFAEGGLPRESFVRPAKLFTASESIVARPVGRLTARAHRMVVEAVVNVFRAALK